MRVALLSYEYPPDTGFGGIGTYTWYQARALARLGHQVRVIAGSLEPGTFHSHHDGVALTRVLDDGPLAGAVAGMHEQGLGWAPNRLRTAAGAHRALRDLLEQEQYDVVEHPECGADGTMVSTMLPVRTCVRFHSPAALIMESYGASAADIEATTFLEQIAIDRADLATAPSAFMAGEAIRHLGVRPPVHVIANGIDLDLFDRTEPLDVAERFGLSTRPGTVTILFAGRLEQRKGAHLLADTLARTLRAYPQVQAVIAGADPSGLVDAAIRPALDVHDLADRLQVLGHLSPSEVRALVRQVDIHLLPTMWDNAPYSCIETMAASGALVTSDVGGMPELIDHGRSGLLARPGDIDSFVDALAQLIEDPELRARLGGAARLAVEERFTDDAMARTTVDLWREHLVTDPPARDERPGSR